MAQWLVLNIPYTCSQIASPLHSTQAVQYNFARLLQIANSPVADANILVLWWFVFFFNMDLTFSMSFPGMIHFLFIDRSFDELTSPSLSTDGQVV